MASTSKPNGISITRDGALKFIVSWKVTDRDYGGGQQVRYRVHKKTGKPTNWTTANVASNFTTKSFTLSSSNWTPNSGKPTIDYIEVNVRGKRATTTQSGKTTTYDWSDWAKQTWTLNAPRKPEVEPDTTAANSTTFGWEVQKTDSDGQPLIGNYVIRAVIDWISILSRFSAFTSGILDYAAMLYYASIAFVFLFLTVRVYEKRRWG